MPCTTRFGVTTAANLDKLQEMDCFNHEVYALHSFEWDPEQPMV